MSELLGFNDNFEIGRVALNKAFSGLAPFNVVTANTIYGSILSGNTIYSGTTELSFLFAPISLVSSPFSGNSFTGAIKPINGSNIASGLYSFIGGGTGNTASGNFSQSFGFRTSATTIGSHSEGRNTLSSGLQSHTEGYNTIASGARSHAEGHSTRATGSYGSHAEGYQTISSGAYSHTEGGLTSATTTGAHAEGNQTLASGLHSHAEGLTTIASGPRSHAEGQSTRSNGQGSHAEGVGTTATTTASHAEGSSTLASGIYSHAEGRLTIASGTRTHAEGYLTTASGINSHAEGVLNSASGYGSHAGGSGSTSSGNASFIHASNSNVLANNASIIGGFGNRLNSAATGSTILGGSNITGNTADMIYGVNFTARTSIYAQNFFSGTTNLATIISQTSYSSGTTTAFSLASGYGGSPSYRKDSMGYIHFKGILTVGSIGGNNEFATLPSGFRPSTPKEFAVAAAAGSNGGFFICIVNSTGSVQIVKGDGSVLDNGNNVYVDGVSFYLYD